jgi:endonuclease III
LEVEKPISSVHFCKRKSEQIVAAARKVQELSADPPTLETTNRELLLSFAGIGKSLVECALRGVELRKRRKAEEKRIEEMKQPMVRSFASFFKEE